MTWLLRTSAILFLARMLGAVLGLGAQLILVRWLGASQYGIYALALALANVLGVACVLGYPSITARFVESYRAREDWPHVLGFIRSARRHLLVLSALAGSILFLLASAAPAIAGEYRMVLIFGACAAPVFGLMRLNGALANSWRRNLLSYLPDLIARPSLFLIALIVFSLLAPDMPLAAVLGLQFAVAAIVCAGLAIGVHRFLKSHIEGVRPVYQSSSWRRAGFPVMVIMLVTSMLADFIILVAGLQLPPADVAVFSICLRLMLLVQFGIVAVQQIVTPDLARAHANGDLLAIRRSTAQAGMLNLAFVAIAFAAVIAFGEFALSLFGESFAAGWPVLLVLMLSQIVRAAFGPLTQLLTIAGKERANLWISLAGFGALVAANLALLPTIGLPGAALLYSGTVFAVTVVQAVLVRRCYGFVPGPRFSELRSALAWPRKIVPTQS